MPVASVRRSVMARPRVPDLSLNPAGDRHEFSIHDNWRHIESAPKDGTRVLAFGKAYKELADDGFDWILADTDKPRVPFVMVIKWVEGWYDKEIDNGDGTYRKERALGYSYWKPCHAFTPTHWMPLPDPPSESL